MEGDADTYVQVRALKLGIQDPGISSFFTY